jgi:hypothetical protein
MVSDLGKVPLSLCGSDIITQVTVIVAHQKFEKYGCGAPAASIVMKNVIDFIHLTLEIFWCACLCVCVWYHWKKIPGLRA